MLLYVIYSTFWILRIRCSLFAAWTEDVARVWAETQFSLTNHLWVKRRCPCWSRWTCPTSKYHSEFCFCKNDHLKDIFVPFKLGTEVRLLIAHLITLTSTLSGSHCERAGLTARIWAKGKRDLCCLLETKTACTDAPGAVTAFVSSLPGGNSDISLITQTASVEWMSDSRTPTVHVL